MAYTKRTSIGRWVITLTALLLLAVSCVGSVVVVFGRSAKLQAANLEASSLADAEVTELIGAKSYTRSDTAQPHSFFRALTDAFHIPFSNPALLLTSELPLASDTPTNGATTQSSLFQSITSFAQQSGKITIGWTTSGSAWTTEQVLVSNPGVNVLCPTWLELNSTSGTLTNHIQQPVIQFAHQRHVRVWALLDNQFSRKLTREVLRDTQAQQVLVTQLKQIAQKNQLDGINIDFENIDPMDRDRFTAFMADLYAQLQPVHIDLSVDITPDVVMLDDDAEFFHAGLARYCDQVILMAYDEHWSNDSTPGPVADVPWVINSVYDLIDTGVPTDKLILGIPFYTRFWHIHRDGSVTSEAVSFGAVDDILRVHNATGSWNDKLGVMYARYTKSDGYEEVWYENNTTLNKKLKLISDSGLAGVAVWTLQLSNSHTWTTLVQSLRQSVS